MVFFVGMGIWKADSKGGSWRQSGGLPQPPWLFCRKANPPSPHQKRNLFCLSDKRGFFSTKSILCRIWRLQHMHEAAFVGQKFIGKCEIVRTGLRCVDDQFVRDLSRFAAHNIDAVGKQNRFVDIMRDEQR